MMNHNFEKKISDKLNQFEIEPSEGLLDSIFEKRAASKKGFAKFPFKTLAAVLGLATIISTAYYFSSPQNNIAEKNIDLANNTDAESNTNMPNVEKENNLSPTPTAAIKATNTIKAENIKSTKGSLKNMAKTEKTKDFTTRKINFQPKKTETKAFAVKNIKKSAIENKTSNELNTSSENIAERYFNIFSKNRPTIDFEEHKGKSHLYVYQTVSEAEMESKNVLSLINYGYKKRLVNTKIDLNINDIALDKNHKFTNKQKPIFLDVFLSPSFTLFKANDKADINQNYNQLNTSKYNQMYGIRVSVPVSNKINVFTGLNYTKQNSQYKGTITNQQNVTTIQTKTEYINDPILGTITRNYQDTTNALVTNTNQYNFANSYTIFQLPLGLSYNFGYRKFDFAPHIGGLFNLYTSSNGKNIDFKTNNTQNFSSNKKHLGIGAGLSFMTAYRLSSKCKLIVEPGMQWYTIKANNAANKMSENRLNNQLTIGLRYTIF